MKLCRKFQLIFVSLCVPTQTLASKAGGVHVIQAFFSEDMATEVQVQGRTARQGKSGTYSLILAESEVPLLLFMSDGVNGDGDCVGSITEMQREFPTTVFHAVIFRQQDSPVLRGMMNAVKGEFHVSIDGVKLLETFSTIASGLEYTGRG